MQQKDMKVKTYRKVLLALELDKSVDSSPIHHALEIVEACESELYVIHVIEHMGSYGAAYGVAAGADIESIIYAKARDAMNEVCNTLPLEEDHLILKQGGSAYTILDEAERVGADLIVVGSHEINGVRLIIGSTADCIVTKAKCDVLAVKVSKD